jgi:D-3-phosphoglycerate dehydrogenase / 2-oxoglutarate reductase
MEVSMKVLLATEKPFSASARDALSDILKKGGHEVVLLESYTEKKDLLSAIADCDAVIIRSDKIDATVLEAAGKLKLVIRAGAGYDNVDCATAKVKKIVVENTPGQNANGVAELAIGMMIMLARNNFDGKTGSELRGKKLGLHAFGFVAQAVGEIAKGFAMKIYAYDPFVTDAFMQEKGVVPCHSVEELYSIADYVSIHIPAIPQTIRSIDAGLLLKMKDKAALINTAREEVINEEDLVKIFEQRSNFKYAADVAPSAAVRKVLTEKYPTRCYFTPKKLAAQTNEANYNAACAAARQAVAFFATGDTSCQVNK